VTEGWTKGIPVEDGWYWLSESGRYPYIRFVYKLDNEMVFAEPNEWGSMENEHLTYMDTLWYRPVEGPPEYPLKIKDRPR